ncbi:hypothetical protein HC028_13935 [Planosporangium flavigriseum]|nr:hypothetical protein [Planosporangium flavigriseum]NJC65589.1 hypothetical protein [Planosporangium flavigriseum]
MESLSPGKPRKTGTSRAENGMSLLRLWLLAFVGFGLTIGAWSLALP